MRWPSTSYRMWSRRQAAIRMTRWRSRSPRSLRAGSPRRRAAGRRASCWPRCCRSRRRLRCRCHWCCQSPSWRCWASSGCPAACASPPSATAPACCCGERRPETAARLPHPYTLHTHTHTHTTRLVSAPAWSVIIHTHQCTQSNAGQSLTRATLMIKLSHLITGKLTHCDLNRFLSYILRLKIRDVKNYQKWFDTISYLQANIWLFGGLLK